MAVSVTRASSTVQSEREDGSGDVSRRIMSNEIARRRRMPKQRGDTVTQRVRQR